MIHAFSVEMKSKLHVKNISISDETHDRVLFEGNLGELLELSFEGGVLELVGVNGVLRVGLTEKQLMKARITHRETSLSAEEGRSKYTQTAKAGKQREDGRMSKKVSALFVCLGALLPLLLIPTVYASPPTIVEGVWSYKPYITGVGLADGNTFMDAVTKQEDPDEWTGTFEGTSEDVFKVVIHSTGFWYVNGLAFFVGTVNNVEGTLVIRFVGKKPDAVAEWSGTWMILSGTGELANLHGQGTWWGPGAPAPEQWGDVDYSGKIHFEPG